MITLARLVEATKREQRSSRAVNPDALLKKLFFKNAVFAVVAEKVG